LLKFWGREQEQEALGVNGRVREQMEWEGKGGLLKPSFQRTPVTASGSFFQPALWEGFFHKGSDSPCKLRQNLLLLGGVGMLTWAGDSTAGSEVIIRITQEILTAGASGHSLELYLLLEQSQLCASVFLPGVPSRSAPSREC
jgi:hypothetical protein